MTRRWRTEYGQYNSGEELDGFEEWRLKEITRVRAWQKAHPDYRQRRNPGIPLMPVEVEGALSRWASATLSKTDGCKSLEYLYLEAYRAIKRVDGIDLDHYIQNRGLAKYLRYLGFTSARHNGVTVFNNVAIRRKHKGS